MDKINVQNQIFRNSFGKKLKGGYGIPRNNGYEHKCKIVSLNETIIHVNTCQSNFHMNYLIIL